MHLFRGGLCRFMLCCYLIKLSACVFLASGCFLKMVLTSFATYSEWSFIVPVSLCTEGTEKGVEQMVSKAHQGASRCINCFCSTLQSLFLQKDIIYIFGPAGPESGPASPRQEENRRGASWRISGASRRITIHSRYTTFVLYLFRFLA